MKRLILILSVLCLSATASFARGIPIPIGTEEKVEIVNQLPDTEDYQDQDGQYVELARFHEEFNILWFIPLWVTAEPKLVLAKEGNDHEYWEVPEETMTAILEENKIDKEEALSLGFWTRYGGKIILLGFIGLAIAGYAMGDDEEEEETEEVEPKEV